MRSTFPASLWLIASLFCSLSTALMFVMNLFFYRTPRRVSGNHIRPSVSVLIPARNEEDGISAAVETALASTGVQVEVLVLDDASTDGTAARVEAISMRDGRVALHSAPPLPAGWNGKQHACHMLSHFADFELLCFLDADVRLAPDALERMVATLEAEKVDLLSGFPLEETKTWLERLLLPLIHFVLLAYLPIPGLRYRPLAPGFAAGCGQIMLVRRDAYIAAGGHAAIRETMHDGILLPKAFRNAGRATGLADLTLLARCRMYRNAAEVWRGLEKNATEGLAAPARIVPFTLLLGIGQIVPVAWLLIALASHGAVFWPAVATAASYLPRLLAVWRFKQSLRSAVLHPLGVAVLLALQWWSLGRKLLGLQSVWKQRAYDHG